MRIDKRLVELQFFASREKAQDAIVQKTIKVNGTVVDKPSKEVDESASIEVVDVFNRYVSRGGLKLEKAVADFNIVFTDKYVLDVGSSTGGFTDCALQHGATKIYAVDVGTRQLHDSLLSNPSVVSIENQDFRTLTLPQVDDRKFDWIISDVSFISLTCLMPFFPPFLKDDGTMLLLIKPQFETGASFLNKRGIVNDARGYKIAIQNVINAALNYGFKLTGLSLSTCFEKQKNIEFLSLFSRIGQPIPVNYSLLNAEIKKLKKNI